MHETQWIVAFGLRARDRARVSKEFTAREGEGEGEGVSEEVRGCDGEGSRNGEREGHSHYLPHSPGLYPCSACLHTLSWSPSPPPTLPSSLPPSLLNLQGDSGEGDVHWRDKAGQVQGILGRQGGREGGQNSESVALPSTHVRHPSLPCSLSPCLPPFLSPCSQRSHTAGPFIVRPLPPFTSSSPHPHQECG